MLSRPFILTRRKFSGHAALYAGAAATLLTVAGCGGSSGGSLVAPTPTLTVTVAGAGPSGLVDGTSAVARFNNPVNVVLDSVGTAFVADFDNGRIRRVTNSGVVSTLTPPANFQRPFGITMTPNGNLFVQTDGDDLGNRDETTGTLWRINPANGAAVVVARNLGRPRGLAAISNTQIVMCDVAQHDVRIINPGTGAVTPLAGLRGTPGSATGTGAAARFNRPYGPAILPNGNIILADQNNNVLRMITPAGVVTTFAGDGTPGFLDGSRLAARFNRPQDVAIDGAGNVYVSDNENHRIRRVGVDGNVVTIAGSGVAGFADGNGTAAQFFGQEGIALSGDGQALYVADGTGGDDTLPFNRLRRINLN